MNGCVMDGLDCSPEGRLEIEGLEDEASWLGGALPAEDEMKGADRIKMNPKVMLGKPVIRGTRIPVELILRKLADRAGETVLLDGYPR